MKLLVWIIAVVFIGLLFLRAATALDDTRLQSAGFACMNDAFKFCSKTMRNGTIMPDAIKSCLRFNEHKLTLACRAALKASK